MEQMSSRRNRSFTTASLTRTAAMATLSQLVLTTSVEQGELADALRPVVMTRLRSVVTRVIHARAEDVMEARLSWCCRCRRAAGRRARRGRAGRCRRHGHVAVG